MERRYKVTVELLQDKYESSIMTLSLVSKEGKGLRITDNKGTGSWTVIKSFDCEFTLSELRKFNNKKS